MNIFIVTLGSRGDVQPYVALGKGLKAAGHSVTVCTSASFESFITGQGLDYGYMTDGLMQLMNTDAGRDAMENTRNLFEGINTFRKLAKDAGPLQREMLRDSWESARKADPDLIIFHPKAYGGPHFAEKLGIPVMLAVPLPMYVPTAEFANIGFPELKLGAGYNRLTYQLLLKLTALGTSRYVNDWRKAHNLPKAPSGMDLLHDSRGQSIPILHGYSPHMVPVPQDWPATASATGFWFLDQETAWQPTIALQDFLDAGDAPVYVGFGSMAGRQPQRMAEIVVEALQQAGLRGIIASGWGGLDTADLPDTILKIDSAPHDWLFPRVAAVVHHGGAGTTAAGLRAGRPTVICPFFGDQPFWGERVHALGVGSQPIPQKQLTPEKLAAAIREVTTSATIKQNAAALGEKLRAEDGVAAAVRIVEQYMAAQARQPSSEPMPAYD